jgi:uncharacterized protein YndB with AHSA1/START domain
VDRIERDIVIAAPPEVVWEVVTEPEHVTQWFAEDGGTRLWLVESGFEGRGGYREEHEGGWTKFLGQLRDYAQAR